MTKKIFIFFVLFFLSFWSVIWAGEKKADNDLTSEGFMIYTQSIFSWWKKISKWWWAETVNSLLLIWIDKLMIWIWVISLLIMLIWAGYMIIYHGQDNLLSKWKTIFTAWIIALIVALSSQMMVRLVEYLIYT